MSQTLPKLSHHLVDDAQYNLLRSVGYLTAAERRDIDRNVLYRLRAPRGGHDDFFEHTLSHSRLAGTECGRDSCR